MTARMNVRRWSPVPGTPVWATVCAWATIACVLPSCAWRIAVGLGVPLGWSAVHLRQERIPGYGTWYVIWLSALCIAAASLTLGLIYRWGERLPLGAPVLGGRRIPVWLAATLSCTGATLVATLVWDSITHWSTVSGFADRPTSGWAVFMEACYAPAVLWAPLLLAVTVAYLRRRSDLST